MSPLSGVESRQRFHSRGSVLGRTNRRVDSSVTSSPGVRPKTTRKPPHEGGYGVEDLG
jgi:hypothetical protein